MAAPADIGVVGAGIVGLATAYALTERGASVTVYERGVPGAGQSGGESRLFRHAHADPRMVRFALRSRAVWREWQERLGVELVSDDGAIAIGKSVADKLDALDQVAGTAARPIDAAELAERLPLLADYDGPAMLDEAGGSIRTGAAIRALCDRLGEALVADEVLAVRPTGRGTVEVRAGGVRNEHGRVVVCAGRGTAELARGAGLALPVELGAHLRLTFTVRGDPPARLACLQDASGAFGETGTYAAPVAGNRRYAVGLAEDVPVREDGSLLDPAALTGIADRTRAYAARALPGLDPVPVEVRHCWVTRLPWGDDGVAVWEAGEAVFVAGHNLFKQAPGLGRALAAAVLGEGLPDELRPEAQLGRAG